MKHLGEHNTLGAPPLLEHNEDLANSELWRVDLSWSTQARAFREMATANPEKLTLSVFMKMLRSLRVVDKKVRKCPRL